MFIPQQKKRFARCKNNLCLQDWLTCCCSCSCSSWWTLPTVCYGGLPLRFFFPPIRFHSGIFTFDKQRSCSVCPRSTSLPLLTKLQRAHWNLYPPPVTSWSPLTFSSHWAEPYINLIPGATLQPLTQPLEAQLPDLRCVVPVQNSPCRDEITNTCLYPVDDLARKGKIRSFSRSINTDKHRAKYVIFA